MNEPKDSFLELHGVSAETAALVAGLDAIERAMAPTVQDTIEPVLTLLQTLRECFYEMKAQRDELLAVCKAAFDEACRENRNQELIDQLDAAIARAERWAQ